MNSIITKIVPASARYLGHGGAVVPSVAAGTPGDTNCCDRLLTVGEVATILRVHPNRVYELVSRRTLPAVRVGRLLRFHLGTLQESIESGGTQSSLNAVRQRTPGRQRIADARPDSEARLILMRRPVSRSATTNGKEGVQVGNVPDPPRSGGGAAEATHADGSRVESSLAAVDGWFVSRPVVARLCRRPPFPCDTPQLPRHRAGASPAGAWARPAHAPEPANCSDLRQPETGTGPERHLGPVSLRRSTRGPGARCPLGSSRAESHRLC